MENCEIAFCKLCLSVITDGNFKSIEDINFEVLDVLQLKLSEEENHESVMCNACTGKLLAAHQFKVTCMDTEGSIVPYVDSENMIPVDLKEIYQKLRGNEQLSNLLEDERICRLCMQFITSGFTSVREIEVDIIQKYIPAINFNSTIDPVVCSLCVTSLNTHSSFLRNCLSLQEGIINTDDCAIESPSYIKSEIIEIKTEDCDEYGDTFLHDNKLVDCKIKDRDSPNFNDLEQKSTSNVEKYQCDTCDFKTNLKYRLLQHELKHKDFSEVPVYACMSCDFKTKTKGNIRRHQLIHKDILDEEVYKCAKCDFKSKYKHCLVSHQLTHKDFSEVKVYKCDMCDYKTKYKSTLSRHHLKHKDFSEIQIYKCDSCDYIAKRKGNLVNHQLKHKDVLIVEIYKCDECDYETKHKRLLKTHTLKHTNVSEVQVYKCDTCDYTTVRKHHLINHQQKHKDFPQGLCFKCDKCDFKTKHKSSLLRHQVKHKDL